MRPIITHNIEINAIAPASPEEMLQQSIVAAKRKDFLRRVNETTVLVEKLQEMIELAFNPNHNTDK